MKKILKAFIIGFICCIVIGVISSCDIDIPESDMDVSQTTSETTLIEKTTETEVYAEGSSEGETVESVTTAPTVSEEESILTEAEETAGEETFANKASSVSAESIPSFSGNPYVVINNNIPAFSEEDKKRTDAFETYSEFDSLGRCGQAYANICPELEPAEERGEIGQVRPSGWHTVKYPGIIDGLYLYNRCHLIGYQLAGENDNVKNLITGTRYLNVAGMLQFENLVDDYVDSTGGHVLYRVTPVYEGSNLVASGVQMEGWSVEDYGKSICFNVYCYNAQPGIVINYADGESWIEDGYETVAPETESPTEEIPQDSGSSEAQTQEFIINTNTKKFHLPGCSSGSQMAEHNKKDYTGTLKELIDMGYQPCKRCLG